MLVLSCPPNQARFNAVLFELLTLKINGTVCILGDEWDCYDSLHYLEKRLKRDLIATHCMDGSEFSLCGKLISFTDEGVFVSLDAQSSFFTNTACPNNGRGGR